MADFQINTLSSIVGGLVKNVASALAQLFIKKVTFTQEVGTGTEQDPEIPAQDLDARTVKTLHDWINGDAQIPLESLAIDIVQYKGLLSPGTEDNNATSYIAKMDANNAFVENKYLLPETFFTSSPTDSVHIGDMFIANIPVNGRVYKLYVGSTLINEVQSGDIVILGPDGWQIVPSVTHQKIATMEGDISGLDTRLTTAEGDIGDLQTDLGTAQGDISDLETAVSNLQAGVGGVITITNTDEAYPVSAIAVGTVVRADATNKFAIADANSNGDGFVLGVVKTEIATGADAILFTSGQVDTVLCDDATYAVGDRLYLSVNAGKVSKDVPDVTRDAIYLMGVSLEAGAKSGGSIKMLLSPQLIAVNA
jgi:hypothetical protein